MVPAAQVGGTVYLCKWLQGSLSSLCLPLPSAGHSFGTNGARGCARLPSSRCLRGHRACPGCEEGWMAQEGLSALQIAASTWVPEEGTWMRGVQLSRALAGRGRVG